jgi:hypothetical protein
VLGGVDIATLTSPRFGKGAPGWLARSATVRFGVASASGAEALHPTMSAIAEHSDKTRRRFMASPYPAAVNRPISGPPRMAISRFARATMHLRDARRKYS